MADDRAEGIPDGPDETAPPTGRSETPLNASPSALLGEAPQVIEWSLSASEREALELFPSEHDGPGEKLPPAQTGAPPSLEEWTERPEECASPPPHSTPLVEEAYPDNLRPQLRQANCMLKELGEETIGLKTELDLLRVFAAQLSSDYQAIQRIADEAQERPALALLEDLERHIDGRIDVLNTLMHQVAVRTQMLQTHKDTIDCALRESGRVAEMVRCMAEQVAMLGEGEPLATQKEAVLQQIEQVALETTWHVEQKKQFRDEVGLQLARLSREAQTLTASTRADIEARETEKKTFTANLPLSTAHAPFGAVTMAGGDQPPRTMSHLRFAAGLVGVWLLIGVISFLVTSDLIRRAPLLGDDALPAPNAPVGLPSQQLDSVPYTDSPSRGSERAPFISTAQAVGRDGVGIARPTPSAERDQRGVPPMPGRSAGAAAREALPGPASRENASADVGASLPAARDGLSGWWMLTDHVERSSRHSFNDLTLGFRMQLVQTGNRVRGHGVKWLENGRPLAARSRTRITVDGMREGRRLALTFTERGARRTSQGSFEMQLAEDGSLDGRFSSDAAHSSGRAEAVRISQPQ